MIRGIIIGIIAGLLYLQPVGVVFADDSQSIIEAIVSNPGQYDGKVVTVEGEVEKVRHTKSFSGDSYTLFRLEDLEDNEDNEVGVYTKGHLKISRGAKVRVMGKFSKEKKYVIYKFKNVIKAKEVEKI
ncbi:MAG TPA: hypothetical protein VHT73_05560 [Thermodesulfobacteriota bacterium]|nr:hypothetical protein [Thermodesulfobacteriota bacterium]